MGILTPDQKKYCFAQAARVGITLVGSDDKEISIWRVIEKLVDRIEELENAVKKNEPDRISGFDVAGILSRDGG